jgi:hypothetical protein
MPAQPTCGQSDTALPPCDPSRCLTCGARSGTLDAHHVIPQAYGGKHGPVVYLCQSCHTLTHRLALRAKKLDRPLDIEAVMHYIYSQQQQERGLLQLGPSGVRWLAYLVGRVVGASRVLETDPRKSVKLTLTLDAETARCLKVAQARLGAKSQAATVVELIQRFYLNGDSHEKR